MSARIAVASGDMSDENIAPQIVHQLMGQETEIIIILIHHLEDLDVIFLTKHFICRF